MKVAVLCTLPEVKGEEEDKIEMDRIKTVLKEAEFSWKVGLKKWVWTGDHLVVAHPFERARSLGGNPELYLETSGKFKDKIRVDKASYASWEQFPVNTVARELGKRITG